MDLFTPTLTVMADQQVTVQEVQWYGMELAGIAMVALVSYMLNAMLEAAWR